MKLSIKAACSISVGICIIILVFIFKSSTTLSEIENTSAERIDDDQSEISRTTVLLTVDHNKLRDYKVISIGKPPHKSSIEWKFSTPKHYYDSELHVWSEPKKRTKERPGSGNGENGAGFARVNSSSPLLQKLMKDHNYNYLATEMMSMHRSLPDYRCDECKYLVYPKKLPTATIIFIFHNEAWSLLIRSIWSIIDHSPPELIEEIILVDDDSDWPELQRPIEEYIELMPATVRLIRTEKREGLIRARLIGAKEAKV